MGQEKEKEKRGGRKRKRRGKENEISTIPNFYNYVFNRSV